MGLIAHGRQALTRADVNSYPLDRCELHQAISKRFAQSRFSVMTADDLVEYDHNRESPMRYASLLADDRQLFAGHLAGWNATPFTCSTYSFPRRKWTTHMILQRLSWGIT